MSTTAVPDRFTTPADRELAPAPLDEKADHVRGSPAGRLIIEYGDYECPYSRQAFHAIEVVEQQLVHVPEPALPRGGLSRGRCGEGVRMDAGQREMPEREPHVPVESLFDLLDRVECLPRVGALVIAVLDD